MLRALLAILIAATALAPAGASAVPIERSEPYRAGFLGDSDGLCAEDPLNPTGENLGVVCIVATRDVATIEISDLTIQTIAGYYIYTDAAGAFIGSATAFCGSTTSAFRPAGGATLVVYIGGPVLGPSGCLVDGPGDTTGIGTDGVVTALFRNG